MENTSDLVQLLMEADSARLDGRWTEARQLYEQAGEHPKARHELDRLVALEAKDRQVQEWLAEGDQHRQAGAFETAMGLYTQALNEAGQSGILKYHSRLEQRRNQTRELLSWHKRAQETLRQAQQQGSSDNWAAAADLLKNIIQEWPDGDFYEPMTAQLRQALQAAEGKLSVQVLYDQAKTALQAQDFEQAIRLAETIAAGHPEAPPLLEQARYHQTGIQRRLDQVETAIGHQRWEHAFEYLKELQHEYPQNPAWQHSWLQVGEAHGQAALNAGREAMSRRELQAAQHHFHVARTAFERVLEVYQTYAPAIARYNEATDLETMAQKAQQAQLDWSQGRREAALAILDEVLERINQVREKDKHDYATVAAVIASTRHTLQAEIADIQAQEQHLREGERLLAAKRLDEAANHFRSAQLARLPDQQRRAGEGLDSVDRQQKKALADLGRARDLLATDPVAAVVAARAAYECWPTSSDIANHLETILLQAGEALWKVPNTQEDALTYFMDILELNPGNRTAQEKVKDAKDGLRIGAALKQVKAGLAALTGSDQASAAAFAAILSSLAKIQLEAEPYPSLKQQVAELYGQIESHLGRWQTYEQLSGQAEQSRQAGDWTVALAQLEAALAPWGQAVPDRLKQRRPAWQAAVTAIETARQQGEQAYQAAQAAYEQAPSNNDFAAPLKILEGAATHLDRAEQAVTTAAGSLPADLLTLKERLDDLRRRAEVAKTAAEAISQPTKAPDALRTVGQVLQIYPDDATLRTLERTFAGQKVNLAQMRLRQASLSLEEGDLDKAFDEMREAYELQPDDPNIQARYQELLRRRRLEKRLRQADTDYHSKLASGSLRDAIAALRQGLEDLCDPEAGLTIEAREILLSLMDLERQNNGMAFGEADHWGQAQAWLSQLGHQAGQSWVARQSFILAARWAAPARDIALEGIIASKALLGDYLATYIAAVARVNERPGDTDIISQFANMGEKLIGQANSSAGKRLGRARIALEQGEFEIGGQELATIETELYAPIECEFPTLLHGVDEVERLRDEARQLRREVERLQGLQTKVAPHLEAAEAGLLAGRIEAAQQELEGLPDLRTAPYLAQQVAELQDRLAQASRRHMGETLRQAIGRAETTLHLATTPTEIETILVELEALPGQAAWPGLTYEQRESYYQMLERAREQRQAMEAGTTWIAETDKVIAAGNYSLALIHLAEAIKVTRDGRQRVSLEARRNEIEQFQAQAGALHQAQALFYEGKYVEAYRDLRLAQQRGESVGELLPAAEAGIMLKQAELAYQQGDWNRAQDDLTEAHHLATNNTQAEEVMREIERLQRRLQQRLQLEAQKEKARISLQARLNEIQFILDQGDPTTAQTRLQALLLEAPDEPALLTLQELIKMGQVLQQAKEAMTAGNYGDAQTTIKTVLALQPNHPAAKSLYDQIKAEMEANNALLEAEYLARDKQFYQAREALSTALKEGANPDRLRQTQQLVEELEKQWEADTLEAIRDGHLGNQYSKALELCEQILLSPISPHFQASIKDWQAKIVNSWVEQSLNDLRQRLTQAADEAALVNLAAEVEALAALSPKPRSNLIQARLQLYRAIHEQRLSQRLVAAAGFIEQKDWPVALDLLKTIEDEAKTLDLRHIVFQAGQQTTKVEQAITQDKQGDWQRRLEQAQQVYNQATGRADLVQAQRYLQELPDLPEFQQGQAAIRLLSQVNIALAQYDETEMALQRSRELMLKGRGRFAEADKALRLEAVSPLFQTAYDGRRALLGALRQAEREQDQQNWAAALTGYRQALAQERGLELILEQDLERCRAKLTAEVIRQVEQILAGAPLEPQRARTLLDQARDEDWITPDMQPLVSGLRARIAAQERVIEAGQLLEQEGDLTQAMALLREARRLLPEGQIEPVIQTWEQLAQAAQAWQEGDLDKAEIALQPILSSMAGVSRVKRLHHQIKQEQAGQQALVTANAQIEAALVSRPARHEEAVLAVRQMLQAVGGQDQRIEQLRQVVQARLQADLEAARRDHHYSIALALAESLRLLATDNTAEQAAATQRLQELQTERDQQLTQALEQAEAALQRDDLNQLTTILNLAGIIAAPDSDRRIDVLLRGLERRWGDLARIDEALREIKMAMSVAHWDQAVKRLLEVSPAAPHYLPLVQLTQDLQGCLRAPAQMALAADNFAEALAMCNLALRLGDDLRAVHEQVITTRQARLAELRQQAESALAENVWDLAAAQVAIAKGLQIAPDEAEFLRLQARLKQLAGLATDLKAAMESGWQAWHKRDYAAARQFFDKVAGQLGEAQRWRNYVGHLEQVAQAAQSGYFSQIITELRWAAAQVQPRPGEPPTPLLPDLTEQRRRALWQVAQLQRLAARLVELERQYLEQQQQKLISQANEILTRLEQSQGEFLRLHQQPGTPPASFEAELFMADLLATERAEATAAEPLPELRPTVQWNEEVAAAFVPNPSPDEPEVDYDKGQGQPKQADAPDSSPLDKGERIEAQAKNEPVPGRRLPVPTESGLMAAAEKKVAITQPPAVANPAPPAAPAKSESEKSKQPATRDQVKSEQQEIPALSAATTAEELPIIDWGNATGGFAPREYEVEE